VSNEEKPKSLMSYPKVLATSESGDLYALLHTENQALLEEISEEGS